jgi:alanyl-tRNA synthetase
MTTRIYYEDPLRTEFRARVVAHAAWSGAPAVVLDATAFYPESGGQMADRGALAGQGVRDVQVGDDGAVLHVMDLAPGSALPAVGAEVDGAVDRARRRVHMALHTGQHMLSRALADVAGAETVSSRLGETACTIDLDRAVAQERDLARAEDLVNAVVDDDVAVRAFFPAPAELAALPLRRPPKVTDGVRIVAIGEFDYTPCGGTHCTRSAQVGLVRVTGVERYKGGTRIYFEAGRRARSALAGHSDVLTSLARELTCGTAEVPGALERLRADLTRARESLGTARAKLATATADELAAVALARGERQVTAAFDDADADFLRTIAARLTAAAGTSGRCDMVAFLAARAADGVLVLVARGADSAFDCGGFVKRVAAASGGRGGGRPERAEGRLPAGADWLALVAGAAGV